MTNNDDSKAIGYIYNGEGKYSPGIYIKNDVKQIASFIVRTKNSPKIVLTDTSDNLILNTIDGYIDVCIDQDFLKNELLKVLIPMQQGETIPEKIEVLDYGVSEEFNNDLFMFRFIYNYFKIDLAADGPIEDY